MDSGPSALYRVPESIAQIAEALWVQALEESRRRVALEQRDSTRLAELDKQRLELRSHVLTLREGELDSRLRDRDRSIEELKLQLRELTSLLNKEQPTRESLTRQLARSVSQISARRKTLKAQTKARTPPSKKARRLDAPPPSVLLQRADHQPVERSTSAVSLRDTLGSLIGSLREPSS